MCTCCMQEAITSQTKQKQKRMIIVCYKSSNDICDVFHTSHSMVWGIMKQLFHHKVRLNENSSSESYVNTWHSANYNQSYPTSILFYTPNTRTFKSHHTQSKYINESISHIDITHYNQLSKF